jgi:hypothetical protein
VPVGHCVGRIFCHVTDKRLNSFGIDTVYYS